MHSIAIKFEVEYAQNELKLFSTKIIDAFGVKVYDAIPRYEPKDISFAYLYEPGIRKYFAFQLFLDGDVKKYGIITIDPTKRLQQCFLTLLPIGSSQLNKDCEVTLFKVTIAGTFAMINTNKSTSSNTNTVTPEVTKFDPSLYNNLMRPSKSSKSNMHNFATKLKLVQDSSQMEIESKSTSVPDKAKEKTQEKALVSSKNEKVSSQSSNKAASLSLLQAKHKNVSISSLQKAKLNSTKVTASSNPRSPEKKHVPLKDMEESKSLENQALVPLDESNQRHSSPPKIMNNNIRTPKVQSPVKNIVQGSEVGVMPVEDATHTLTNNVSTPTFQIKTSIPLYKMSENSRQILKFILWGKNKLVVNAYTPGHNNVNTATVSLDTIGPLQVRVVRYQNDEANENEFTKLSQLSHPLIPRMLGKPEKDPEFRLLEYLSNKNMTQATIEMYEKNVPLDDRESQVRKVAFQLVDALHYLHNGQHVAHFNLTPDNIWWVNNTTAFTQSDMIQVANYGTAMHFEVISKFSNKIHEAWNDGIETFANLMQHLGIPAYAVPPEFYTDRLEMSEKVDMWQLGVSIFYMLFGEYPFGNDYQQVFDNIAHFHRDPMSYIFPGDLAYCSQELRMILQKLWKITPADRCSLNEVSNSPWFNGMSYGSLITAESTWFGHALNRNWDVSTADVRVSVPYKIALAILSAVYPVYTDFSPQRLFTMIDQDYSGDISLNELKDFCAKYYKNDAFDLNQALASIFILLDVDGNERLSYDEFLGLFIDIGEKERLAVFKILDTTDKGYIDESDFANHRDNDYHLLWDTLYEVFGKDRISIKEFVYRNFEE